jgi:hypothetical protein
VAAVEAATVSGLPAILIIAPAHVAVIANLQTGCLAPHCRASNPGTSS